MGEPVIATQADYHVPLLRLLADYPYGQADAQQALSDFYDRYSHCISKTHLEPLESNPDEKKWSNFVRWSRKTLKDRGLLDMPYRGVWKITSEGRAWLDQHPDSWHLDGRSHSPRQPRSSPVTKSRVPAETFTPPGLSLDMLEQTRKAMGDEKFRPVWGAIYDQLLAVERAKAITEISDAELTRIARRQVRQVQDYLRGRSGERPTGEQICDWIHFCYQFSLFREAAALFATVNADEVNPWYLERTRKIAVTSRGKL